MMEKRRRMPPDEYSYGICILIAIIIIAIIFALRSSPPEEEFTNPDPFTEVDITIEYEVIGELTDLGWMD